jgi:hypothetical protein
MNKEETGTCSEDGARGNYKNSKRHLQIDAILLDRIIGGMTFWKQQIGDLT